MLLGFIKKTNITSKIETFISSFLTLHCKTFSVWRLKEHIGESILLYQKYYLVIYILIYLLSHFMLISKYYYLINIFQLRNSSIKVGRSKVRTSVEALCCLLNISGQWFSPCLYQKSTALATLLWYIQTCTNEARTSEHNFSFWMMYSVYCVY